MLSIREQQIAYLRRMLDRLEKEEERNENKDDDDLRYFSEFWMREMMRKNHPTRPLADEEAEHEKNLAYYTLGWFLYDFVGVNSSSSPSSALSSSEQFSTSEDAEEGCV